MNTKLSAHTPGPWNNQEFPSIDFKYSFCIDAADGQPIADIRGWHSGIDAANARLIAAAPCLLEALESLLDLAMTWKPDQIEDDSTLFNTRQAIAKAKG